MMRVCQRCRPAKYFRLRNVLSFKLKLFVSYDVRINQLPTSVPTSNWLIWLRFSGVPHNIRYTLSRGADNNRMLWVHKDLPVSWIFFEFPFVFKNFLKIFKDFHLIFKNFLWFFLEDFLFNAKGFSMIICPSPCPWSQKNVIFAFPFFGSVFWLVHLLIGSNVCYNTNIMEAHRVNSKVRKIKKKKIRGCLIV